MLPCKEIVHILSSDENISWMRRMEFKLHLKMCRHCSNYAAQLKMIKSAASQLFSKITALDAVEVAELENEVVRQNIKQGGGSK